MHIVFHVGWVGSDDTMEIEEHRVMVPDHTIGVLPLDVKYCVARSLLSTVCILNDAYVRTPDIAGTGQ